MSTSSQIKMSSQKSKRDNSTKTKQENLFLKMKNRKGSSQNPAIQRRKTTINPVIVSPRHLMLDSITIGKDPIRSKGIPQVEHFPLSSDVKQSLQRKKTKRRSVFRNPVNFISEQSKSNNAMTIDQSKSNNAMTIEQTSCAATNINNETQIDIAIDAENHMFFERRNRMKHTIGGVAVPSLGNIMLSKQNTMIPTPQF